FVRKVEFRTFFCAPSRNFKILAIPIALANKNLYEHGFAKKCEGHKLWGSRVSIDFSCTVLEVQNTGHSQRINPWEVILA
ncbi:hypothetical protein B296_00032655, partial [Ensete ventricosum]